MSRSTTLARIDELKSAGEDFEFYPSTPAMIKVVSDAISDSCGRHDSRKRKILDIGAGDGRVLNWIAEDLVSDEHWNSIRVEKFAIEKATPHLIDLAKEVVVVGTDFHEQTLIDKPMHVIFCNPPYSEFACWTERIIRESCCTDLYMIIPKRWSADAAIKAAVNKRDAEFEVLGSFDFESADRSARAKVDIVRFTFPHKQNAAFDAAIEKLLPELDTWEAAFASKKAEKTEIEACRDVSGGGGDGVIQSLVTAYDSEQMNLVDTYRDVVKMNPLLLKELGVCKENVINGLRQKITHMKDRYWKALFDNVTPVTQRLATKQREAFLNSLKDKAVIDFTEGNIYSMLMWITKWGNDFFDEQLIQLYKGLAQYANVSRYKSNDRVLGKGHWRYLDEEASHYKLEYRLVIEGKGGINGSGMSYYGERGLKTDSHDLLNDLVTVANNLGFICSDSTKNYDWLPNKQNKLLLNNDEPLVAVRAFKNGNLHIHLNKRFALALNVEAGRLLGWLHSPGEAATELDASKEESEYIESVFGSSFRITDSTLRLGCSA